MPAAGFGLSDFGRDLSELKSAPWLQISPASDVAEVRRLHQFLDTGASEAIVLAKELHADYQKTLLWLMARVLPEPM